MYEDIQLEFMPGSPFDDEKLTEEQMQVLYQKYGLDKPIIQRFFIYVKNMLTGDFGVSYVIQKNMPISVMLSKRLIVSVRIGLQAMLVELFFGLIFGIVAAIRHNSFIDTKSTILPTIALGMAPIACVARFICLSMQFR